MSALPSIVLQKSFCGRGLKFSEPWVQRSIIMWGTTPPCAKLTGDSGNGFEAALIGDCRLFRPLAENQPQCLLRLLQHYLPIADMTAARLNKPVLSLEQIAVDASQSTLRASKKNPAAALGAPGRGGFEKGSNSFSYT